MVAGVGLVSTAEGPAPDGGWVEETVAPEPVPEPGEGAVAAARRVLGGRRRRNAGGGRRANQVNVRLTDEEFAAVAARAAAARVGVAHYLALRALDVPTRAGAGTSGAGLDLATKRAWAVQMTMLRRELNRVWTNLNQIARLLNGTGEVARGAEQTLAATEAAMARVAPIADWMADTVGVSRP